jgi:hypothetical protein
VPDPDLRSIPGLQENHRRELAARLGITGLRALAGADQRAVYEAVRNIRPRPSLARIASWQNEARSRLSDAAIDQADWDTAASFAVIFAQRQVNGVWERRLEAEQTEVEPATEPQEWPGWDCGPLCDWMFGQLDEPAGQADSKAGTADETVTAVTAEPAPGAAPPRVARAELRIDSAKITDAHKEFALIRAGDVITAPARV